MEIKFRKILDLLSHPAPRSIFASHLFGSRWALFMSAHDSLSCCEMKGFSSFLPSTAAAMEMGQVRRKLLMFVLERSQGFSRNKWSRNRLKVIQQRRFTGNSKHNKLLIFVCFFGHIMRRSFRRTCFVFDFSIFGWCKWAISVIFGSRRETIEQCRVYVTADSILLLKISLVPSQSTISSDLFQRWDLPWMREKEYFATHKTSA